MEEIPLILELWNFFMFIKNWEKRKKNVKNQGNLSKIPTEERW